MANLTFTNDNQIIRDLYNTPEEAIAASQKLGCNGYRTYVINGESKYVPCSNYSQYEKALRYKEMRGTVGAFGSDAFGDKLVGLQFANSKTEIQGDPFFTLGNFSIENNKRFSQIKEREKTLGARAIMSDSVGSYTVDSITNSFYVGDDSVEELNKRVFEKSKINILFDKRKLNNYVLFSSLQERLKNCLIEIYNQYPASLNVKTTSIINTSVYEYNTFRKENSSTFKINLTSVFNPFDINIRETVSDAEESPVSKYRDFTKHYGDYVLVFNNTEYEILSVQCPNNVTPTVFSLSITGNPFGNYLTKNWGANVTFYIKPKQYVFNEFYTNLSDLASFLLNKDTTTGDFRSEFIFQKLDSNNKLANVKEVLRFPMYDDYNIDLFSNNFEIYTTKLNDIAESYDSTKTNLIARYLTTDSLQEFDTEDRQFRFILQLMGKSFDDIKKYIDGITFMRNVSYDKIENIPDVLLKNFANMLGFSTFNLQEEDSLIESLFRYDKEDITTQSTPAELDIELWRRILINAFYMFKAKGTRKSIEFILRLVGLPDELFELNEYVYVAENKLNVLDVLNKIYGNGVDVDPVVMLGNMPFDNDGYPTIPINVKFQESGGYLYENNQNIGEFDFGQKYIQSYKKAGGVYLFDIYRVADNIKSHVYSTEPVNIYNDNTTTYTEYFLKHSDLTINSKELEVYFGTDKIFDLSIYRQYLKSGVRVNNDINITNNLKINPKEHDFSVFIQKCLDNFTNLRNRKTIQTYPSLIKIYIDYLNLTGNPITVGRDLEFLNKFDTNWVKLIQQFIPATTIINAGKKIENSKLLDSKFVYKHGINTNQNWLGTDGSEFQEIATLPINVAKLNFPKGSGLLSPKHTTVISPYHAIANEGLKYYANSPNINQYYGFYYSFFNTCDEERGKFYIWDSSVNYADAEYGGFINNTSGETRGVFVIYDNKLYRLNTNRMFNTTITMDTIGGVDSNSGLPPNEATISGETIWELVPFNIKSNDLTFKDVTLIGNVTNIEKTFFMNSIGLGFAYMQNKILFDCPPPKPHVCYYDRFGKTINMSTFTSTHKTYVDETGMTLKINQPQFYGYSKDPNTVKPDGSEYGTISNWVVPYKKLFNIVDGETYYKGEVIGDDLINPNCVFVVTGDTYTHTGANICTGSTPTGLSVYNSNLDTNWGLYELYEDRTKTNPLMHIETALITKAILQPDTVRYTINLTKSLNLTHIFSGVTPETTYKVDNNVVNNELYIADDVLLEVDGFYAINPDSGVGPFYTQNEDVHFIHTLDETVFLQPNTVNRISIQSLNENFNTVLEDAALITTNPGYYLVTKTSYLKFDIDLYFESSFTTKQKVNVSLFDSDNYVYKEVEFEFVGDDNPHERVFNFEYSGIFQSGVKIYVGVNPIDIACNLSRYETINYATNLLDSDVDETEYNELDDARFRVLFNSGTVVNGDHSEGLSIKSIYNNDDLLVNDLKLKVDPIETKYINIPIIDVVYDSNEEYNLNKIFTPNIKIDVVDPQVDLVVSKNLYYDKVNFNFIVRSKLTQQTRQTQKYKTSSIAPSIEIPIVCENYYIGGGSKMVENSNANTAVSIGKLIQERTRNFSRTLSYIPKYSFYKNEPINSGNTTMTDLTIAGNSDGLTDFRQLNYSFNIINEITNKKRFAYKTPNTPTFQYYALENDIYENELYLEILNKVPIFDPNVINYELNDVVKVPIYAYKKINIEDADSVLPLTETTVYRLFVCVNDIGVEHVRKTNTTSVMLYDIHEIYRPRGARSCFIEIEKYNPANFTPWGYEDNTFYNLPNTNIYDYINKTPKVYDDTEYPDFQLGDIVISSVDSNGTEEYFQFVYPKPLVYDNTQLYQNGDFVVQWVKLRTYEHQFYSGTTWVTTGVTRDILGVGVVGSTPSTTTVNTAPNHQDVVTIEDKYKFYFATQPTKGNIPYVNATSYTGFTGGTVYWTVVDDKLFNHTFLGDGGEYDVSDQVIIPTVSWLTAPYVDRFGYCTTAVKLPRTLHYPIMPTLTDPPYIDGSSARWSSIFKEQSLFVDTGYMYLGDSEIINTNKLYKSDANVVGFTGYTGITVSLTGYTGDTMYITDDYEDINSNTRLNKTNIFLKKAQQDTFNDIYFLSQFMSENHNIYPLFIRIGYVSEKNNPNMYTPNVTQDYTYKPTTYDWNDGNRSVYLGEKYAVNNGVLYKYIGDSAVTPTSNYTQPYLNQDWVEKDFCLVKSFTYYKDRTKIAIYSYDIESLTDTARNNLYFFNPNYKLKSGFTSRSFTGTTINEKLISGLNKFYDITDANRLSPTIRGATEFRVSGGDIMLDYYPERDDIGFPLSGEFLAKLKTSNPCGHIATTIIGILFNFDVNSLNRNLSNIVPRRLQEDIVDGVPYLVRVIVNQNGESNATLGISTQLTSIRSNIYSISPNSSFDNTFSLINGDVFEISITYNTLNNQTTFGSAQIDGVEVFIKNAISDNNLYQTTLTQQPNLNTETRTFRLKNVDRNSNIVINLNGVEVTSVNNITGRNVITIPSRKVNPNQKS